MRRFAVLILALISLSLGLLASPGTARSDEFGGIVQKLASGGFSKKAKIVDELAASGHDRAAAVLEALMRGALYSRKSDGTGFVTSIDRDQVTLIDPVTGKGAGTAPRGALKKIRVNNKLRRAIRAALGSLTLRSADPVKRLAAAKSVFKSRDLKALPALDAAIKNETDPDVKRAFEEARAAVVLSSDAPESDRIAAIAALRARGDRDALALLTGHADAKGDVVAKAAAAAIASMEQELAVWNVVQNSIYGLSLGSVLLLAAIGLAITFGVMGVINMAHGEMVMLGAYTTFMVQEIIRESAPGLCSTIPYSSPCPSLF